MSVCAVYFHFQFRDHTLLCVKGGHLTRSDICQWAQDLLSTKYSTHGLIFPSGLKGWNIAQVTFDWNASIETFCILPMIKFSWTFTLTVPSCWNDLPDSIQAAESLIFSTNGRKHISFIIIWSSNSSTLYSNANSNLICFFELKTNNFNYSLFYLSSNYLFYL